MNQIVRELIKSDENSFLELLKKFFDYAGNDQERDSELVELFQKALQEESNLYFFCS